MLPTFRYSRAILPAAPRRVSNPFSPSTSEQPSVRQASVARIHAAGLRMEKKNFEGEAGGGGGGEICTKSSAAAKFKPEVNSMQPLLISGSSGGWEKCWEQGLTPWDLGRATPVIVHLHQAGVLPKGRALVPGCGTGYDVVAMACADRHVVGLEISDKAIEKANELFSALPNASYFKFLKADFFNWNPSERFDLIFDYTFFCAIEPKMRSEWAQKTSELLKPDGELITLIFPIDDHVGGPPYKVSVGDYEEVLHPMGFKAVSIIDNDMAVGPRKGREKLGRWKRFAMRSSSL